MCQISSRLNARIPVLPPPSVAGLGINLVSAVSYEPISCLKISRSQNATQVLEIQGVKVWLATLDSGSIELHATSPQFSPLFTGHGE
jgi:hypothetical protein